MSQVGVPFGQIEHVSEWLDICVPIGKPPVEHPKRPILGFECPKSTNPDRIRQNIDLFSFELDAGDMKLLAEMNRGDGVAWASGDPTQEG